MFRSLYYTIILWNTLHLLSIYTQMPIIFVLPLTASGFTGGPKHLIEWIQKPKEEWHDGFTTIEPFALMRYARVGYVHDPMPQHFTVHHVWDYNSAIRTHELTARWWESPVLMWPNTPSEGQPETVAYGFQFRHADEIPGDIRVPGVFLYRGVTFLNDELYRDMTRMHDEGKAHFPYIGSIWKNVPLQEAVDKIIAQNRHRYDKNLVRIEHERLLARAKQRRAKALQQLQEEADSDDDDYSDDEPDVAPSSGGQNGIPEDPDLDAKMALLDDALDALGGAKGRYKRKSKKAAPKPKGKKKRVVKPKKKRIAKRKK